MNSILFVLVLALFGAKIAWNLSVPYQLAVLARRRPKSGITLMPEVEGLLLVVGVIVSWIGERKSPWNPGNVAVFGATIIGCSYILLFVASAIAGWIRSRVRK